MLSDITILITSFLRPGYLLRCIDGIRENLPDCNIVIVDDSDVNFADYPVWEAILKGCQIIYLPFDSGLSAKRNAGIKAITTEYVLMGSDDFDFSTPEAYDGIVKMHDVLEMFPEIDVAGGRHSNVPYEGFLEVGDGYIREHRLVLDKDEHLFYNVDLTCNYWLGRTAHILPWDERMKIGGEHGDWFLDMKAAGRRTVWVPGVNINPLPEGLGQDKRYPEFRARARSLGHRIFKEKRKIQDYIGFDGDKS